MRKRFEENDDYPVVFVLRAKYFQIFGNDKLRRGFQSFNLLVQGNILRKTCQKIDDLQL